MSRTLKDALTQALDMEGGLRSLADFALRHSYSMRMSLT